MKLRRTIDKLNLVIGTTSIITPIAALVAISTESTISHISFTLCLVGIMIQIIGLAIYTVFRDKRTYFDALVDSVLLRSIFRTGNLTEEQVEKELEKHRNAIRSLVRDYKSKKGIVSNEKNMSVAN